MDPQDKIPYHKAPLSLSQQVEKLKSKGLIIPDKNKVKSYLSNISYYRLRAYTYPYQDNSDGSDHHFIHKDISFNDIIDIYCFDRRLRSLVFNALEKIEISIRTKIIQVYSESTHDSHWYDNDSLYRYPIDDILDHIAADVDRSTEDFIKHYDSKYSYPPLPPSWMALEVVSFSTLSRLFQALKADDQKSYIVEQFGLKKIDILENWLHALSNLRNCCAHHSRIWNRRFLVNVTLPYNTSYPFIDRYSIKGIHSNKLFALLSCIAYLLNIISPGSDFKRKLKELLKSDCRLLNIKDMGFPQNWQCMPVWLES